MAVTWPPVPPILLWAARVAMQATMAHTKLCWYMRCDLWGRATTRGGGGGD
jgi:hypothetical protein